MHCKKVVIENEFSLRSTEIDFSPKESFQKRSNPNYGTQTRKGDTAVSKSGATVATR
jgi:hypothetical protein